MTGEWLEQFCSAVAEAVEMEEREILLQQMLRTTLLQIGWWYSLACCSASDRK